jgi:ESCRT-I complex subunit TSG101
MERWLREHAGSYGERERVCADVGAALARFPSLRPKSDMYSQSLSFPVPPLVTARSVRRWPRPAAPLSARPPADRIPGLVLQHPRRSLAHKGLPAPPADRLCRPHPRPPRPSQQIRRSQRPMRNQIQPGLDQEARGPFLPYSPFQLLTSSKPCNLAELLQAMQDHFSRAPPLYAKPKSSSPRPAQQPLPSPSSSLSHPPLSRPQSRHDDDRPALPPKPISSQMPPRPSAASPLPYPQVCPSYSRSLNAPIYAHLD